MRTIPECPDCKLCANFNDGDVLVCTNPSFPPSEVEVYSPLGDMSAEACTGFSFGNPPKFTREELAAAEIYSEASLGEKRSYPGLLSWILAQKSE